MKSTRVGSLDNKTANWIPAEAKKIPSMAALSGLDVRKEINQLQAKNSIMASPKTPKKIANDSFPTLKFCSPSMNRPGKSRQYSRSPMLTKNARQIAIAAMIFPMRNVRPCRGRN